MNDNIPLQTYKLYNENKQCFFRANPANSEALLFAALDVLGYEITKCETEEFDMQDSNQLHFQF